VGRGGVGHEEPRQHHAEWNYSSVVPPTAGGHHMAQSAVPGVCRPLPVVVGCTVTWPLGRFCVVAGGVAAGEGRMGCVGRRRRKAREEGSSFADLRALSRAASWRGRESQGPRSCTGQRLQGTTVSLLPGLSTLPLPRLPPVLATGGGNKRSAQKRTQKYLYLGRCPLLALSGPALTVSGRQRLQTGRASALETALVS